MISVVNEKTISFSTLASHPRKPFQVISGHFDNTIIFWDLLKFSDIFLSQLKFSLNMGLIETVGDSHDVMNPNSKGKIAGDLSRNI